MDNENNQQSTKIVPISIWLSPTQLRLNFCMVCRENLHFQIEGVPKQILIGVDASSPQGGNYRPIKFPIVVRCSGKSQRYGRCPAKYIVQGYIDE